MHYKFQNKCRQTIVHSQPATLNYSCEYSPSSEEYYEEKFQANIKLGFSLDIYSKEGSHRHETLSLLIAMKSAKDANVSMNSYLSERGQNHLKLKSKQNTEPRKQLRWINHSC